MDNPNELTQFFSEKSVIGGAIVGTIETTTQQPVPEYNPTDVALMARYTQQITHWRDMEQSSYDRAA